MPAVVPTVTIALSELVRLQGFERRALGCKQMLKTDAELLARDRADQRVDKAELGWRARTDHYVGQYIDYVLNEAAR